MYKYKIIIIISILLMPLSSALAGIILAPHKYAWSDNVGYINFEDVIVDDNLLSGYAWSTNNGFINFSPAEGGVLNDGAGNLSGSAWGEQLGWIDFDNVSINEEGIFSGTAIGDLVGTITFDCPDYCDVQTDWQQDSSDSASSSSTSTNRKSGNRIFSIRKLSDGVSVIPSTPSEVFIPGTPDTGFFAGSSSSKNVSVPIEKENEGGGGASVIDATVEESVQFVQKKILGILQDDFMFYGSITTIAIIFVARFGYTWRKRRRARKLALTDYPRKKRRVE